jgi:hypothetical protein
VAAIALEHLAEPVEQMVMVRLGEAEPGEHRGPGQRTRQITREVRMSSSREGVDQVDDLAADDRLEPALQG